MLLSPQSTPRFGGVYPAYYVHSCGSRDPLHESRIALHDNFSGDTPLTQKCFQVLKKAKLKPQAGYFVKLPTHAFVYVANDSQGNHASTYHGLSQDGAHLETLHAELVKDANNPHGHLIVDYNGHVTQVPAKKPTAKHLSFGSRINVLF